MKYLIGFLVAWNMVIWGLYGIDKLFITPVYLHGPWNCAGSMEDLNRYFLCRE